MLVCSGTNALGGVTLTVATPDPPLVAVIALPVKLSLRALKTTALPSSCTSMASLSPSITGLGKLDKMFIFCTLTRCRVCFDVPLVFSMWTSHNSQPVPVSAVSKSTDCSVPLVPDP